MEFATVHGRGAGVSTAVPPFFPHNGYFSCDLFSTPPPPQTHPKMSESPPIQTPPGDSTQPQIPVEIISEEEMALLESALLSATTRAPIRISRTLSSSTPPSPTHFQVNVRSIDSIAVHSKRRLSSSSSSSSQGAYVKDIEDLGNTQKRNRKLDSLLHRFRRRRALAVTDIVASEWCQKQMEFTLVRGKPKATKAMKAGTDRHAQLEEEVVKRVEINVKEREDIWAVKLMNFIVGVNQLLFEGLTRELTLFSFVQGVWMVGVIDELHLPTTEYVHSPFLVEIKTRSQSTLPSEAQKRNGKLQLMCYKYMWDTTISHNFPASRFYSFFGLNSHYILSEEVQGLAATSGISAKTLDDLVMYYGNTCATLSTAQDELLLRYEFQGDNSLLGEEKFTYDSTWLMSQLKCSLEFWLGEREPNYVSPDEDWKCRYCQFASICPNISVESTAPKAETEELSQ